MYCYVADELLYLKVHNNLNNILETLNERGIVEINSVQHNETTREREPAEIDLIVSNKGMASGSIVSESECSLRELCLVCSAIKTINDRIETLILDLSVQRLIGSCDTTKMFVRTSDQKRKKLPCPYCMKLVCKLSRHVKTKHKNEKDVIDLTSSNGKHFFVFAVFVVLRIFSSIKCASSILCI